MASATSLAPTRGRDFAALLDETLGPDTGFAGSVVSGRVVRVDDDYAIVDVGLKSEGRVPLKEFAPPGAKPEVKAGDIDRALRRALRRPRRRDRPVAREGAARGGLDQPREGLQAKQRVNGVIFGRVKGGFTVDLGGAVAFLPGSQVDIRPVRDVGAADGHPAALPDPQDGPRPRQHRRVAAAPCWKRPAPNSAAS